MAEGNSVFFDENAGPFLIQAEGNLIKIKVFCDKFFLASQFFDRI